MIFIISLILSFGFALSAIFIGFGQNFYRLSNQGFISRAIHNAELEAIQYGNLYLRCGVLDPEDPAKSHTAVRNLFTYDIIGLDQETAAAITITSSITASKNAAGVLMLEVRARK